MPYSKSNKEIQEARMGGVGKYKSPNTYAPFKMKAKNNDPMTKNYGPVAPGKMRAFGTKDSDMPDKVSTTPGMPYAGGVSSSPAKIGAVGLAKRLFGGGGSGAPGLQTTAAGMKAKMAEALAKAKAGEQAEGEAAMMADADASAAGGGPEIAVPPHGDEAHTGGGGGGAKKKMWGGIASNPGMSGMRGGFGSLFAGI